LGNSRSLTWQEYERELQDLMTKYVGRERNDIGLRQALEYLQSYAESAEEVHAENGHELMRAHEAFDLRLFDEMMTAAALERDETRFSFLMGHYRTDHLQEDDQKWKGVSIQVGYDGKGPVVERVIPTPAWREAKLAEKGAR
jgi:succinate dehydrogenase/fumarate reductase flavoprotein subunit